MSTKLIKHWQLASNDLNIRIDLNYSVPLKSGEKIKSIFIVEKFGAEKGLLVLLEGTDVSQHTEELNQLGYGYTFLSEPFEN
jgi:hypothetical protein